MRGSKSSSRLGSNNSGNENTLHNHIANNSIHNSSHTSKDANVLDSTSLKEVFCVHQLNDSYVSSQQQSSVPSSKKSVGKARTNSVPFPDVVSTQSAINPQRQHVVSDTVQENSAVITSGAVHKFGQAEALTTSISAAGGESEKEVAEEGWCRCSIKTVVVAVARCYLTTIDLLEEDFKRVQCRYVFYYR